MNHHAILIAGLAALALAVAAGELERREWTVEGVVREALVYAPPQAKTNATPAVFVFHGYGGNMRDIALNDRGWVT